MNLSEERLLQMLQEWGRRERERLELDRPPAPEEERAGGSIAPASAPAPRAEKLTPRRVVWFSAGISALAACIVTMMTLWVAVPGGTTREYAPRTAAVKAEQTRLAATASFAKGWRRAGMVVSVSDYSAFRSAALPDLDLALPDAAAARRVMHTQMRAPLENILSLSNRAASEVAVMSGIRWLSQFNQPNDLVVIHVACHALVGPDGRLRLVLSDSRDEKGKVTGLPAEDMLRELESLPGMVILVADTCHSGALAQVRLAPRHAIVASAGEKELAFDSVFGNAWLGGLESGKADANLDGAVTLQEAFDHVIAEFARRPGTQRPQLLLGSPALGKEAVLALHPQLSALLPQAGAPMAPPGVLEFVPDGACELWLGGRRLGVCSAPVALVTGPGVQSLRAVRNEWGAQRSEWVDPMPVEVPPGRRVQRAAVFSAPRKTSSGQLPLLSTNADAREGNPFPQMQAFGDVPVRYEQHPDGSLLVQFPSARRAAPAGMVMLASDAVTGVNLASILGADTEGMVSLTISAKVETGTLKTKFFVGGRISESLNTRLETETVLDDRWQTIQIKVPAAKADNVVTGFGLEVGPSDSGGEKILVRDVTFRR
ncbi:hypothetical protein [Prosthecobacter sp.]|uniref:hypothetical protein n=1 Tax=Prosthecobacter sp. TaxID=1965333 RepID=UPI0037846D4E